MAPGGMPVASSPVPLGDKGHYAFVFPVRPGETRFQVSYRLPYTGSYQFSQRLSLPAENVAIMMPKSMKFTPGAASPFQTVNDDVNAQTFLARNVSAAQPLVFTVAGTGAMPREAQGTGAPGSAENGAANTDAQPTSAEAGSAAAASDTRPGGGLGNPIDTPDPLTKYRWWILGGLSLVLAAAAAFFLRKQEPAAVAGAPNAAQGATTLSPAGESSVHAGTHAFNGRRDALLGALKEELFALETERLEGKLGEPQYLELKAAFETVLRRALQREPVAKSETLA